MERDRLVELLPSDESHITMATAVLADDGSQGEPPDLIIVDARVGGSRALVHVERARRRWPTPAMLCLNVVNSTDAVDLLAAGADDVSMVDTPFDVVSALVSAALRRVRVSNAQARIKFGDLIYDREARRVWCAGQEVIFTPRELRLFDILFLRAGNPVSADTLQDYVWNDGHASTSNALAVYIGYLRKKLRGSRISMLETLRGSGYRLARRAD